LRPIWDALYEAGAALVLNAHNRNYERFAPQAPDGTLDQERGIRQFIVGTGGASHASLSHRAPNSEAGDDSAYGVLKLTLEAEGYSWEFVPAGGATFTDTGSGTCPNSEEGEPPPPPGQLVLVGAGDIARCDNANGERTAVLLDQIEGIVFTAGDHVEPDAVPGGYDDCYGASWGRHKERTWPAIGNNDYYQGSAAGYFDYWGDRAGERDKGYYSYDAGAWHIVVLNSNLKHAAAALQEQWLRADLAANSKRCIMAYWHHPLFFTASVNRDLSVKPLWDALYEAGTALVVNGHRHHYERFAPQTPTGDLDPERGIRQFIVGTGGAGRSSLTNVIRAANSEVLSSIAYGVLKLTLVPDGYSWEFISESKRYFADAGTGTCP
jgi:hypothetical protein